MRSTMGLALPPRSGASSITTDPLARAMSDIHAVTVPKWGLSMDKGTVTAWHKQPGDTVRKGEDLLDVESDRLHPAKRNRPFASGALATRAGPPLAAVLFVGAAVLSAGWLRPAFGVILASYVALALAYSVWLKRVLLVDVFTLTSLSLLRLLAGGYATGTRVTEWLIAFAVFLFTSLAFVKRYTEISQAAARREGEGGGGRGAASVAGRAYDPRDLSVIESVGPASGYLAVLVLAHLSDRCNRPDLALDAVALALKGTTFRGRVLVARQDAPLPTLEVGALLEQLALPLRGGA